MKEKEKYVFISYTSKNKQMADSARTLFLKNSIPCWMAPGDIPAGRKYADVINKAIKNCSCLMLLLSNATLNSVWVPKEVERAINCRKPIIPVQLEDVTLNDEFEMYISTDQIVPVQKFDEVSDEITNLLTSIKKFCEFSEIETCLQDVYAEDLPASYSVENSDKPQNKAKLFAQNMRISSSEECLHKEALGLVSEESKYETDNSDSDFFIEVDDEFFYMMAVEFEKAKNELDAVRDYQSAADLGNSKAQVVLGVHYFMGDFASIGVNYEVSKTLFEKAAQQGDKYAQYNLGVCYETGAGVDENLEEAFNWYQKSANQGLPVAQKKLAECYYCGRGVPPDYVQTIIWLTTADGDDENDKTNIPSFIINPAKFSDRGFDFTLGLDDDPLFDFLYFTDGIIPSCLKEIYSNYEKSDDWAYLRELANKQSNVSLQYHLAEFYLSKSKESRGFLITEDEESYLVNAAHYLLSAAEQGHSQAAETYKQLLCDKRAAKILKKWGYTEG